MKQSMFLCLLAVLASGAPALGAPLIFNEYNATSDTKLLPGGDATFGSVTGNGGNWLELVVTQDHLDIRGWKIEWSNADPIPDNAGNVVFTNNALWSDVRSGTIITLREDDTGAGHVGARPTDVSFNPGSSDFWLEINVDDPTYIVKNGFKVDNDDWQGIIKDTLNGIVQGPVGEAAGSPWTGGGLASTEAAQLNADPTAGVIPPSAGRGYRDVTFSSYGLPNAIAGGTQDFSSLRAWAVPEPSTLLLAVLGACGAMILSARRRGG